jgi:NOL1/NOP2/sun family putative RNA methylase
MISLEELRKKLPADALKLIEETFNPALFNQILLSFRAERKTTFRINTLKSDKNKVLEELRNGGFKFKNINFLSDAFQLDGENNNKLLKSNLVSEGKIYLQSISSLLPPAILKPEKGDNVLDIAAAPGSKTTQMSAMMENKGNIDAIEPDFVRMERLKFNANQLGAANINFFQNDGQNFCEDKIGVYNKVLSDVPCSGEGRFSVYDKNSYGKWKLNNVERLSNLQKKLLKSAILSAKINGIIVYSTCTLNVFENEKVLDAILKDTDFKIKILPIDEKFKSLNESVKPVLLWKNEKFDNSISNCLRIVPSNNMEGFFICKMQRIG